MYFKHIYDDDLAQGSYLIGCQASGEALVVDPRRDIGVYLELAEQNNLRLEHVTETHIHADYLSGARELAEATGAALHLSDEGSDDWKYRFASEKLHHGNEIRLGNIRFRAVHTPGHTPEHLSFLVTDGATGGEPGFFLTGDFVFVGDVGRPDLLDEAALGSDTRFEGAKRLFESLKTHVWTLPDWVQVWPGHGAGSACGKALGAVSSTTIGYEKRFSWWADYLRRDDEAGFVAELLAGQPDAPSYFSRMKRLNRAGPPLLGERGIVPKLEPAELRGKLEDTFLLLDTRSRDAYRASSVPASLHLPAGKRFATHASYVINPEEEERPIVLLAADEAEAGALRDKLARVGIDRVAGYVSDLTGLPLEPLDSVPPNALSQLDDPFILDVRNPDEYEEGHLPGATRIAVGRLGAKLSALPRGRPIVVYCQSGSRATLATAFLRAEGFAEALELEGGYPAWAAARLEQPA